MTEKFSYKAFPSDFLPDGYEDLRTRMIRAATASFEANRVPGVAYSSPQLVERDNSFFFEWRPVGFIVNQDGRPPT